MAIINGTAGNDSIPGTQGDDWIAGNQGNDAIRGQGGNDTLDGGPGADTFFFSPGDGDDTIWNFAASGKHDTIVLQGVLPNEVTYSQSGRDVLISYGHDGDSILVQNVTVAHLTNDILFA